MAGLAAIHADPLGLLVAFGAGMLSFLSPCVLPLVPAYLSMVSGLSAAELSALRPEPRPALVPAGAAAGGDVADRTGRRGRPASRRRVAGRRPGPTAAELRRERSRLLRGILAFIAGFTVVFTILGASASALGRLFLTHQRALETVSGIAHRGLRGGAGGHGRRCRPAHGPGRRAALRRPTLGARAPGRRR